jgi:23S rRNA (adenine2503-C2)-methyltransferase
MNTHTLPLVETASLIREAAIEFDPFELERRLDGLPRAALRARQVWRWLHAGRAESFDQMTDLPCLVREDLARRFTLFSSTVARHAVADDQTHKLVLQLRDRRFIECVLIQEDDRRTACISTQVGCGMGCVFCASGMNGVERNLSRGEILEQLLRLRNLLPVSERLTHVVVMGMGEPLANLDNLLAALRQASDNHGLGISARRMTISTVGLPEKIRRLAEMDCRYHLAVSLHAPTDELRTRIVPTNAKVGIAALLAASDYYFARTGRQVTFEYVLLGGLNDTAEHARQLVETLRGRRAHVNLIPFNEVQGLPYLRPSDAALREFLAALRRAAVSVKVRKRKGSTIDAACGQLRRRVEEEVHAAEPADSLCS